MGKKPAIPREIKSEVERIVEDFNRRVLDAQYYLTRFSGRNFQEMACRVAHLS